VVLATLVTDGAGKITTWRTHWHGGNILTTDDGSEGFHPDDHDNYQLAADYLQRIGRLAH
jgi:hypothetical protein